MLITGWDTPLKQTRQELAQLAYEGYVVPEQAKAEFAALDATNDAFDEAKLRRISALLENLPRDPDFNFAQPNDLVEIKNLRPQGPRRLELKLSADELLDRLHGAWTGRAAGCALGKPVESLAMGGFGGLNGRNALKKYLQERGQWELDYYFSGQPREGGPKLSCPESWRENINYMEPDDDIHYSLIGLKVLEEKGPCFTWVDVANAWNSSLPYSAICTAETQAILNYNLATPRTMKTGATTPEFTRRHNNPYREWIGAQIRADGWAYCCAGNPELAAEFAWRDAHWTHTANGIYGEMFLAAMIAAAFVEKDPLRLVEIGLSEIPGNCRLAADVRWAMQAMPACPNFEAFMEKAEERFQGMSSVHTCNNAIIIVMSLFYGNMNPDRSICISVMGGLDTDCNGASTGSIVGAAAGRQGFGGRLATPLNDTVKPLVFGFQQITMRELAERTFKVHQTVSAWSEKRA